MLSVLAETLTGYPVGWAYDGTRELAGYVRGVWRRWRTGTLAIAHGADSAVFDRHEHRRTYDESACGATA